MHDTAIPHHVPQPRYNRVEVRGKLAPLQRHVHVVYDQRLAVAQRPHQCYADGLGLHVPWLVDHQQIRVTVPAANRAV